MGIQTKPSAEQLAAFSTRAAAVGAKVHPVAGLQSAAAKIAAIVAEKNQTELVIAPIHKENPTYTKIFTELGQQISLQTYTAPTQIAATWCGLSFCEASVAETGSVVFATNDLTARLVAMLTYYHIVVVEAGKMLNSLDEVGQLLQAWQAAGEQRYISLVTGPSRTADIERVLTIGVQGPQELHIILLA